MTTLIETQDPQAREAELVAWAATFGPVLAEHAARHDAEGSWVQESFEQLRDAGLLALAVPTELGGMGATIRQTAMVMRELAHHCGSTALALSMHQHVTNFTAWRYRRELPGAEATLRRIVDDRIVIVSTGGGDFVRPRGEAVRVDGGYKVSGRKIFASQSPVGAVMATMFPFEDPERGLRVLNLAVPFNDPGVTVHDNWDTLGMRGTASNDVTIDDVFVPDERVLADRPYGVVDPPLQIVASIAFPIVARGVPRCRRVRRDGGDRRRLRHAAGERSVRATTGRADAQPPPGSRAGRSKEPSAPSVTTRRPRWRQWPR